MVGLGFKQRIFSIIIDNFTNFIDILLVSWLFVDIRFHSKSSRNPKKRVQNYENEYSGSQKQMTQTWIETLLRSK